jgi:predicted CoA-binding protein
MEKITLVLGASPNPERVSYDALKNLLKRNIPVIAIGRKQCDLGDVMILKEFPSNPGKVHTIALYMSAANQVEFYDRLFALEPKRIIFNPGSENPELEQLALKKGIEIIDGCLLVMLKTGQF